MLFLCEPNRVRRSYIGGHRIDALRGKNAPDALCPEEWIASVTSAQNPGCPPTEGLSRTRDGRFLSDILAEHPEYLGKYSELPILLKLLDASERLVIQVHPTVEFAKENLNSPFGKTECWYVLSADPGAHVYLGFKEGITRKELIDCFERQDIERMLGLLHKIELSPGDIWLVDGGVPHAIGGGCLLAELQEPTDLMAVPERVTPSGRVLPEERLHCGLGFERMFDMFDYTGYSLEELKKRFYRKADGSSQTESLVGKELTDKFALDEFRAEDSLSLGYSELPRVFVVFEGSGFIEDADGSFELSAGDCGFIASGSTPRLLRRLRVITAQP